ncbi:DUF262 domain-containing protein [Agromyces sp. NPDC058110]|uniref:DUF262 domain-containing protein n=1 Tax=Agromyces sp. NPDC058110 TaxID=3346345 RepID=UPI0036D87EC0
MATAMPVELTVRSESIQQAYTLYGADRFRVNRRYQRKLVWSVEEKARLVDSVLLALPIPLFLVAEISSEPDSPLEVIDGMQRLNAIFAFIEQEFSYNGDYFNLETLADTKDKLDAGVLKQKTPVMSRASSVAFANYSIALSVFRASDQGSIDEVFRRINSGGRRLSKQELRQAGTLSPLATMVRRIASTIRRDTSPGDTVPLRKMPLLSISSKNLEYGIPVNDIFWVKENILRRDDVRESLDEQTILDILIDCLIEPMRTSNGETRDSFYSFTPDPAEGETEESVMISARIDALGAENVERNFLAVYDIIRTVVESDPQTFSRIIGIAASGRGGRYFHALFLALWELMFVEAPPRKIADAEAAIDGLRGISNAASTTSGGDWGAGPKRQTVNAFKGILRPFTVETTAGDDYSQLASTTHLETIISNALVEQQPFDCKQGFFSLNPGTRAFDEGNFGKIVRTLTAMANIGPTSTSYLMVGIADDASDADRVKALDSVKVYEVRGFHLVGIEREVAQSQRPSMNDLWAWILQRISSHPDLTPAFAQQLARDARLAPYREHQIAVFKVSPQSEPVFFGDDLYDRVGSSTVQVAPGPAQFGVFARFK